MTNCSPAPSVSPKPQVAAFVWGQDYTVHVHTTYTIPWMLTGFEVRDPGEGRAHLLRYHLGLAFPIASQL